MINPIADHKKAPSATILQKISIIWRVLRIAKNPGKAHLIEQVQEQLSAAGFFRPAVRLIREDWYGRQMLDGRYLNSGIDLQELKQLGKGALGYEYAEFLEANGLEPIFYSNLRVVDDSTYVIVRIRQTHDIFRSATAILLLGGAFFRCLIDTSQPPIAVLEAVERGLERPRDFKPLFGQKWEDYWSIPLEDLRQGLRV